MNAIAETFEKLVSEKMADSGFQFESSDLSSDAAVVKFKRGHEAISVVSSRRELQMNAGPSQLEALAAARVHNAIRTAKANG